MIIKHKTVIALAFCVLFAFFAMSCGSSHPDPKVESLQITPTNPSIPAGASQQMTVIAVFEDGTTGDVTSKVSWSSSDETVATVSAGGIITPTYTGTITTPLTAEITAMYGFNVLTITVTIIPAQIFDIAISPSTLSIANGTSAFYNAIAYFTDGGSMVITSDDDTIWTSSDETVATISNATGSEGRVTAAGVGPSDSPVDVTISARYSTSYATFSDSVTLTVTPALLSSISIGPASASIAKGTSQQFTATGLFGDGSTQTLTNQVTWRSSNETVASISNSAGTEGLATALGEGTAVINAVDSGTGMTSGNASMTVTPAVLDTITVTASDPSVPKGSTRQVAAIGTFTDSSTQDITSLVTTWASSAPWIANVSSTGLVTGENQGTAFINAVYSGIVASDSGGDLLFTVNDKELVSIAVIPSVVNIPEGGAAFQFDAEGTFTDSSTEIITSQVGIWSSDKPGIANVVSGLATSGTQGTALINAVYSGSLSPGRTVVASDTLGEATLNVVPAGTVIPLYNTNGADWNDYVANDGSDRFNASDTTCNVAVDTSCLHGGEMRMVEMPSSIPSCAGLSATDGLGAFNWTCDSSTSPVRMVSTGLRGGVNLSDLLDFSVTPPMWKKNWVTATDGSGSAVLKTADAVWWTNPIVESNFSLNNSNTTSGDVYVITSNPSAPHTIEKDNIALVVKPGVTITGSSFVNQTIVSANSANFLWFEGTIDAAGDTHGISLTTVTFSVLRSLKVSGASSGTEPAGIYLNSSFYNMLSDITVGNNYYGIAIELSSGNFVAGITAFNNGKHGVYLSGCSDNVLSEVTSSNNAQNGVYLDNSPYNVLTNIAGSNTGTSSVVLLTNASDNNTLTNVTAANSAYGVILNNSSNTTFTNLAVANNNVYGILFAGSSNNFFSGLLKVGSNGGAPADDCFEIIAGTDPGLVSGTCANQGPSSNASLTTGITLASSFVGKVSADDTTNTSDSSGSSLYDSITDWCGFENSYRGWGLEGSLFPATDNQGQCTTGIFCRIWDWSLANGDTVIKDVLAVPPDGSYTLTHTWSDLSSTIFLRNAVEVTGDGIGNDNTLCESDETCLYTPNIGSYQGHGSLMDAAYVGFGGTLQNITLKSYSNNGR